MKQRRKEQQQLPLVNKSNERDEGEPPKKVRIGISRIRFWIGIGLTAFVLSAVSWLLLEELWTRLLLPHSTWTTPDDVVSSAVVSLDQAEAAVVSLHRGYKFHGHLGHYLEESKRRYARIWGYAYANQQTFRQLLTSSSGIPTQSWHLPKYYDKLRFLLVILRDYPNLQYVLWMDGDALVTNPQVILQERARLFVGLHANKECCLVWGKDSMPNAGVMLLYNTALTRALLTQALTDPRDKHPLVDTFYDQASLMGAIRVNQTYQDCTLLLQDNYLRLLQSRTRRWSLYRPSDWILHLPNHNRYELVTDLAKSRAQFENATIMQE
jgi:galactosyl transferase GMA12/MNN10 family